jgi:hypothetical protein
MSFFNKHFKIYKKLLTNINAHGVLKRQKIVNYLEVEKMYVKLLDVVL